VTVSAIYEGTVRHRRHTVRGHRLRHRLALLYLDLEELPDLLGGRLVARRPGPVRFRRRDYLGDPAVSLAEAVRDAVEAQTADRPRGPIRILTQPRTFGHCFNPVSFYYCMEPSGQTLRSVVAEVTNTPWGERHAYVLPTPVTSAPGTCPTAPRANLAGPREATVATTARATTARATTVRATTVRATPAVLSGGLPKALHVSPFMGMDHRYQWRLTTPGETLSVHIESHRQGRLAFDATLALRRRELTRASLARMTARYPLATVRVLALIYAHALRLKLEGVPVHPHPRAGTT
jgi:uncharacterized protein